MVRRPIAWVFVSIDQTLTVDIRGRECAAGSQQADG
jgi:hypothetical protein